MRFSCWTYCQMFRGTSSSDFMTFTPKLQLQVAPTPQLNTRGEDLAYLGLTVLGPVEAGMARGHFWRF